MKTNIVDLFDETGQIIHNSFMERFEIKYYFRECNTSCKAIPSSLKQLIKNSLVYENALPELKIGEV